MISLVSLLRLSTFHQVSPVHVFAFAVENIDKGKQLFTRADFHPEGLQKSVLVVL